MFFSKWSLCGNASRTGLPEMPVVMAGDWLASWTMRWALWTKNSLVIQNVGVPLASTSPHWILPGLLRVPSRDSHTVRDGAICG